MVNRNYEHVLTQQLGFTWRRATLFGLNKDINLLIFMYTFSKGQ